MIGLFNKTYLVPHIVQLASPRPTEGSWLAQGDTAGQQWGGARRACCDTRARVTASDSLCPNAGDKWLFLPSPLKAPISGEEVFREAKLFSLFSGSRGELGKPRQDRFQGDADSDQRGGSSLWGPEVATRRLLRSAKGWQYYGLILPHRRRKSHEEPTRPSPAAELASFDPPRELMGSRHQTVTRGRRERERLFSTWIH